MAKWKIFTLGLLFYAFTAKSQYDFSPENVGGKVEAKRIISEAFCPDKIKPENRLPGKIILTFIVNKDKSIDSLNFAKSYNDEVDKEIESVFPAIQWLPALIENEPVSSWHMFEFRVNSKFFLNSDLCDAKPFDKVYSYIDLDEKPEFIWGDFNKWVYNKLEYPEVALKKGIEGSVLTRFVIEKNGKLSNVGIARSVGGGCDEEALRVIRISQWRPGRKEGKPIRTQVYYQITFKTRGSSFKTIHSGDMIKGQ
ncbi:energy transducer TonB [Hyphobacterium sp. CCMP332]|nr:energy transducer TonB [Hyphobacterium sp. CCMP332]